MLLLLQSLFVDREEDEEDEDDAFSIMQLIMSLTLFGTLLNGYINHATRVNGTLAFLFTSLLVSVV